MRWETAFDPRTSHLCREAFDQGVKKYRAVDGGRQQGKTILAITMEMEAKKAHNRIVRAGRLP